MSSERGGGNGNVTARASDLIIWPPMVIIMNTLLKIEENEKWIGMGNQELVNYFKSFGAVKGRHSYGPSGHRGMSVLIFERSAIGYMDARNLSNQFELQGLGRKAWNESPVLFSPCGKRQLHGYMATEADMAIFNQHSQGKSKLKFEMVSYKEKVYNQSNEICKDNQQLHWYKKKDADLQMYIKELQESLEELSQNLRKCQAELEKLKKITIRFPY